MTLERTWRPDWPCSVASALSPLRRGAGDPTYRIAPDGSHVRGLRTPEGAATLAIRSLPAEGVITGRASGPGAAWALDAMPRMLGAEDDPSGFVPPTRLERAWRTHQHWRIGATGLVLEALVPAIIEQKVTGQEAFAGFRRLVRKYGEPAPALGDEDAGVFLQPNAEMIRQVPSWEWLRLHIDGGRSRPLLHAAGVAPALERAGEQGADALDQALRSVPGIGVWTSAEVRSRALGDADSVSFGDYHVAKNVGWALTGVAVDDAGLAVLLEPYRPHRHRVQRLVELAGLARPRRGPRMSPRTHLPARSVAR